MKIINPLYDNAFKYLMDNEQIAKLVLSIILDEEVISLQSKPQETPIVIDNTRTIARYDFKAVVRGADRTDRTILIELQKYKHPDPITRFREYLAQNYQKEETIIDTAGKEQQQSLPIVTIYILGYKITQADILALQVGRYVRDIIWNTPIEEKLDFVELLTHTSFIFQVGVQPQKKRGTRLEYFLSLFSQKMQGEASNYCIDVELDAEQEDDAVIKEIVSHLNRATLDESVIRSLKHENDYEKGIRTAEEELKEALAEKEKERAEKEKAINKLHRTILRLYEKGFSLEEIAEDMEMKIAEIKKIIGEAN